MFKSTLFGTPLLNIKGENLSDAITGRCMALFAYLVVTGIPHDRSTLANLLWNDVSEHKARTNLRYVLYSLRKEIGSYLTVTRHTIKFNHQAPYWLDTEAFASYLSLNQSATLPTMANLDLLQKAIDLYQGDFLAGFYIQNAPVFEDWMLQQREKLRQEAVQGLSQLVTYYADQDKYDRGIKANNRLIELEPWNEEAHRQQMRLLAYNGQRSAALAQYATCCRVLENEYGTDPLPETQQLYEQIRSGLFNHSATDIYGSQDETTPVASIQSTSSVALHNFPAPLDAFIGRKEEIAAVNQSIQNPYCRLITIVGPGGIGKTRLMQEAIQQGLSSFQNASLFSDGIYYISLTNSTLQPVNEGGMSPATAPFIQTIANGIGYISQDSRPIAQQLQLDLAKKQRLLILDNFEYLTSDVQWLISSLRKAPNLKVLITTRRRLNIQGEQTFTLTGLPIPTETDMNLEANEAILLFLQRAKGVDWRFSPTKTDLEYIKRICQLVNGSPLAIELAAQWLRAFDCANIVNKLEQSLDFLVTDPKSTKKQHHTLRSMFEDSWQLLNDQERRLLIHLSTIKSTFSSEAVQIAGQISIPLLLQLLDHSFLRSVEGGQFEIDRLMYPYIVEKQHC